MTKLCQSRTAMPEYGLVHRVCIPNMKNAKQVPHTNTSRGRRKLGTLKTDDITLST